MDMQTAAKRIVEIFVLDDDEYKLAAFTEKAAKDSAEALSLITGNQWVAIATQYPDKWLIKPTGEVIDWWQP